MVNEKKRNVFGQDMASLSTNLRQTLTHSQGLVISTWRYMVARHPSFKEDRLK
jgi:hypothetical protein